MKKYLIELAVIILAAVVILGSYHVYSRIEAHNQMDAQLIELVKRLQVKQ